MRKEMTCARLVAAFLLAASPWLAVAADKTIDSEHSTLKNHVGKAGLFSAAGHEHWVTAPIAEGSFNDSDSPHVAFTVDARKLRLLEDNELSAEGQKNGVNRSIVSSELTLHGQRRPILAEVHDSDEGDTDHSTIKQTDFGISPVSVGGGVVKVENDLEIQSVIVPIR